MLKKNMSGKNIPKLSGQKPFKFLLLVFALSYWGNWSQQPPQKKTNKKRKPERELL